MSYFPSTLKKINGLKESNLKDFICNKKLKRGAMIASGGYAGQNFYSIMASKIYDIEQKGFCFWAHRYIKSQKALDFATNFFDFEGEKFLLMTYTNDITYAIDTHLSIQKEESIDEYYSRMWSLVKDLQNVSCVKGYRYNNEDNWFKYPNEMFPEIIFHNDDFGIAYLISEFSYFTEKIAMKDMCAFFKQKTQTGGWNNDCTYYNRPNHRLIELKKDEDIILLDDIKKTDKITYIIAKLKYPYIAQLE